jgi:monothiol glutaredoxin
MTDTIEVIKQQISENPVLLYMKGSPNQPMCGFSAQTVQSVMSCGRRFAYVDILQNPEIRAELPKYAQWPTFPQLWVNGELVGGNDIITGEKTLGQFMSFFTAMFLVFDPLRRLSRVAAD